MSGRVSYFCLLLLIEDVDLGDLPFLEDSLAAAKALMQTGTHESKEENFLVCSKSSLRVD